MDADVDLLFFSLWISSWSTLIVLFLSLALSYFVWSRSKRMHFIVDLLVSWPLVMPPVAVGYLLLLVCGQRSYLGAFFMTHFQLPLVFNEIGAVMASVVVALGIAYRSIQSSLQQADPTCIEMAQSFGAHKAQIFFFILLPSSWPGLACAMVLAFIRSLSEFGATMVLAGNISGKSQTLAMGIWTDMHTPEQQSHSMKLVFLSFLLGIAALGLHEWLMAVRRKKMQRT